LECHGNGNREGDLDLQTLAGVRVGGHSGSPLLAEQLEQSELYLRVTSTSDGYRMPKRGEPLSPEELKTLGDWIQATEPTGEIQSPPNDPGIEAPVGPLPWLAGLTASQQYQVIGILVAILLLLVYLAVRGVQTRNKKLRENPGREQASVGMVVWVFRLLLAGMFCAAVVGCGYYYVLSAELRQQVETLQSQVSHAGTKKSDITKPIGPDYLPQPPSPMHPLRLGGRYYRGNDERDPSLFNGGFYRTATIDLKLVGADGSLLEWGDESTEQQFVEIVIERANEATKELFSERVREGVTLLHVDPMSGGGGVEYKFEADEPEQRWRAVVPLAKGNRNEGMIYMMYGVDYAAKASGGDPLPRPHFGIRYEVNVVEGRIAGTSSLWMGSMYTLGGRVMVPKEGQVLLDRWFDWREIPAIQGKGSSDPKLLGLPEHTPVEH